MPPPREGEKIRPFNIYNYSIASFPEKCFISWTEYLCALLKNPVGYRARTRMMHTETDRWQRINCCALLTFLNLTLLVLTQMILESKYT